MDSLTSINILKGSARYAKGIEYLEQAVEHYIRADADQEAADTALKLAESYEIYMYQKGTGNAHEMSKYWELAGDCVDDFNEKKSIECYHKCAYYQKTNNNFQSAAKTYHLIAQLEQKRDHMKEALQGYDLAAEAFTTQGSNVHAAKMLVEKAEYLAKEESYNESAMVFVEIIKKGYLPFENHALAFKSMLAMLTHSALSQDEKHILQHDALINKVDETWGSKDTKSCYERKCVMKMVDAFLKQPADIAAFTRAIKDYDIVSTLTTWSVELLLIVKRVIQGRVNMNDTSSGGTYQWIQTSKTADVSANDEEDVQNGIYHREEHVTQTHSEKYADLFL
jgi:alpha-soluble NSF attachment protein